MINCVKYDNSAFWDDKGKLFDGLCQPPTMQPSWSRVPFMLHFHTLHLRAQPTKNLLYSSWECSRPDEYQVFTIFTFTKSQVVQHYPKLKLKALYSYLICNDRRIQVWTKVLHMPCEWFDNQRLDPPPYWLNYHFFQEILCVITKWIPP